MSINERRRTENLWRGGGWYSKRGKIVINGKELQRKVAQSEIGKEWGTGGILNKIARFAEIVK